MSELTACGRRLQWSGGEHDFDLGAERVQRILRGTGIMPMPLMRKYAVVGDLTAIFPGQFGDTPAAALKRFEQGVYSISDVERVIELGLYGGGLKAEEAAELVDEHVRGEPLAANAVIAYEVLAALFVGAHSNAPTLS